MDKIFNYSYKAGIIINAGTKRVWDVLVDQEKYGQWNPFTTEVITTWKVGEKVELTVQMKKGRKPISQTERLLRLDPQKEIIWGMNWGFFLKAARTQRLTKIANEGTEYYTEDKICGILSPLVHSIYGRQIQHGFESMAGSLKKYIEDDEA